MDKPVFFKRLGYDENQLSEEDVYVKFSQSYSHPPVLFVLNESVVYIYFTSENKDPEHYFNNPTNIDVSHDVLIDKAKKCDNILYSGIKLRNNLMTMEEIEKNKKFIKKVGKWLIFDRNKNYYLIVNSLEGDKEVSIPTKSRNGMVQDDMENPMYWYLEKESFFTCTVSTRGYRPTKDYHELVIDFLKNYKPEEEAKPEENKTEIDIKSEPESEKKVKGFFDFLKRK